jgi:hypothetical protein
VNHGKKTLALLIILVAAIALYGILTLQILTAFFLIGCIGIFSILLGYVWYVIYDLREHIQDRDDRNQLILAFLIILTFLLISPLLLIGFMLYLVLLRGRQGTC